MSDRLGEVLVIAIVNMSNRFCLFKLGIVLRKPASVLVQKILTILFQDIFLRANLRKKLFHFGYLNKA